MKILQYIPLALGPVAVLSGCAYESQRVVDTPTVQSHGQPYSGPRYPLAIGQFQNTSPYMRGIFSDGSDRLGGQAKTILKTHLSNTGRFHLYDRANLEEMEREAKITGTRQELKGARYLVSGQVTEFGRKVTGGTAAFGILGRSKQQVAYSKVSLNIVDVKSSEVVYSVQGAGEFALTSQQYIGFGSTASYDSTLNGKVLNLSITDAINKMVAAMDSGTWRPDQE